MGKSENYLFFGNYCSLRSQSCLKHFAKWVYEVEWVSKVKVILWFWSKVTQISKLKLVFRRNSWAIWNQNSHESLRENMEWKFIQMSLVTWPRWLPCPYMVKIFKKSSSPEPIQSWSWNLVCSITYVSTTTVVQIKSLVWPWLILRQDQFGHIGFWMGKSENYLFFGNHCSLRSQCCLQHLAKWVNDVEWVSKFKVILWP